MKDIKKAINSSLNQIIITSHFVQRYNQRVSPIKSKLSDHEIRNDIENRLSHVEKYAFTFFKNSKYVKVPMNKYQIVIKDKHFITIY
jgi:hypothetical protein